MDVFAKANALGSADLKSAEAHCADLLFHYEDIEILIEAKNHTHHLDKVNDLQKFHDDIEAHSKKGFPKTAAILISLYDIPLIHGHRLCHFEVRYGMPVLYIGGALDRPVLIQAALQLLARMAKTSKFNTTSGNGDTSSEDSSDDMYEKAVEAHRTTAVRFMIMVRKMQDDINRDRRAHDEELVRLNARERSLAEFITYQSDLLRQFSGIEEDVRTVMEPTVGGGSGKRVVNRESVLEFIREKNGDVTEAMINKEFGLTRATLKTKLGAGIRELKAQALKREDAVTTEITESPTKTPMFRRGGIPPHPVLVDAQIWATTFHNRSPKTNPKRHPSDRHVSP